MLTRDAAAAGAAGAPGAGLPSCPFVPGSGAKDSRAPWSFELLLLSSNGKVKSLTALLRARRGRSEG